MPSPASDLVRFQPAESRRKLVGQLLWFLLWLGTTAFAIYLHPDARGHGTHQQLGLNACPSTLLFDRPCPGCGLTTSFTAMVHGMPLVAFKAHALGPGLYLLFTFSALACFIAFVRRIRMDTETKAFNWALGALMITFFVYGGLRFWLQPQYNSPPAAVVSGSPGR